MKWQLPNFFSKFESTVPTRTNKIKVSTGDADRSIHMAGKTLREQARHLEENHDLVSGILTTLVNNTVGTNGIAVEPLPRNTDGTVNREFADELSVLFEDWSKAPEVTGVHTRASMERVLARSMYRDGEVFAQNLVGRITALDHNTIVPYSIEMLEADMVPENHPDSVTSNNFNGVIKNAWGRPIAYQVYHKHPGSIKAWDAKVKEVRADKMMHMKLTNRIGQTRGVSAFAPVMIRLQDLKSYEEAERIAARMSACVSLYIQRGNPELYQPGEEDEDRMFEMAPGTIYDNLLPGEQINDITPDRPSQLLQPFRDSMLKAASSGVNVNYSTIANDYAGTYSSQRQAMIDAYINYGALQANFTAQFSQPMWEKFLTASLGAGLVEVPDGIDTRTVFDAKFRGPVAPWIDPAKEASGNLIQVRAGFKSLSQVIRERGENPRTVLAEIQREREEAEEMGITLSAFAETDDTNLGDSNDDSGEGKGIRTQGNS